MTHPSKTLKACLLALAAVFAFGLVGPIGGAIAQDEAAPATEKGADKDNNPSQAFAAAPDSAPRENLPAWPFLYGAYGVIWLLVFLYILFLWRKHGAIESRLQAIDKRMDDIDAALEDLEKHRTS